MQRLPGLQEAWRGLLGRGSPKSIDGTTRGPFFQSGTLLITYDEFRAFVSKCVIESSVLLPTINTLFELQETDQATKKKVIRIRGAYLSMLSATTPEIYARVYTPAFLHIGFPNRVFLCPGHSSRRVSIPPRMDEADRQRIQKGLLNIQKIVGKEIVYDVAPEALELFDNWYLALERSVHARRLDTYAKRFMLLLALNNEKRVVDAETAQHAILLCDWQLQVRKIFDPIDADTAMARMEQSILRNLDRRPMKDRVLKKNVHAYEAGLWTYQKALETLQAQAEIAFDKRTREFCRKKPV